MKTKFEDVISRTLVALSLALSVAAAGCGGTEDPAEEVPDGPICDPIGETTSTPTSESGLKGDLYAIPRPPSIVTTVSDMITNGTKMDIPVYLTKIDLPTQLFDYGFVAGNGLPLTTQDGKLISDYFALRMEGRIQLSPTDPAGPYQFALYSDDGSMLYLDTGAGLQNIVNNDGSHQAILKVSTTPVTINAGDKIKVRVDYMQGEPDYIAFVLLMRPWPTDETTQPVNDPAVGDDRTGLFWDSTTHPSTPGPLWTALLSRGWKVLNPGNYLLPENSQPNPCVEGK